MTVLVNFGGPRDLDEVQPFLEELLSDQDVIKTRLPGWAHRLLFKRVARKRAFSVRHDYETIGGKSPIFFDTERLAELLREKLGPVVTFHRYLTETHARSLRQIKELEASEIRVLPLFPQFSYSTTGSIARFFAKRLSRPTLNKLRWIKSYPAHPSFIRSYQARIAHFLHLHGIAEEESILLFSAHGLPQSYVDSGDIYEWECKRSFEEVAKAFPKALSRLSYQSKFGPEEWLKPYTNEVCEEILTWHQGRKNIVIIPIAFTSDHIETLFEIETMYLPPIRSRGLNAYRCPALNLEPDWIDAIHEIFQETNLCTTDMLIRSN